MSRLLIEGGVASLFPDGGDYTNAGWVKSRTAVTPAAAADPTGAMTLTKLSEVADGERSYTITRDVTVQAGVPITLDLMAMADERPWVQLFVTGAAFGGGTTRAWIDLVNGELGVNGGNIAAQPVDQGDGIYRISITATPTSSGTATIGIATAVADNSPVHTGVDGAGLHIGRPVLVTNTIGTWAPTGRAPDILTLPLGGARPPGWGTLVLTFVVPSLPGAGGVLGLFARDDGTLDNRLYGWIDSLGAVRIGATAGGVVQAAMVVGTVAPGAIQTVCGGFDLGGSDWSVNGYRPVIGPAQPPGATIERYGQARSDGFAALAGEIETIRRWSGRLPAAAVQAIAANPDIPADEVIGITDPSGQFALTWGGEFISA